MLVLDPPVVKPKERPILFSAPMIRALLDGTKTQTRRVAKAVLLNDGSEYRDDDGWPLTFHDPCESRAACPYGSPGDRLWVREAYSGPFVLQHEAPKWWAHDTPIWYWADGNPTSGDWSKPKPSIHMPRWASRIELEVTDVRVQRLQEISAADALAEGVFKPNAFQKREPLFCPSNDDLIATYRRLWESINGPGSWDANPWVWAVSFKRIKP